jgi:hypothetical protein
MKTSKNVARYLMGFTDGSAKAGQQLSAEYEAAAGVSQIAAAYEFPEKYTATEFDHWAASFCSFRDGNSAAERKFLNGVWDSLVKLNPQLGPIKTDDNPLYLRNGIFGAASRFNPDDISFFIELQKRTSCSTVALLAHSVPLYQELTDKIDSRTGVKSCWVASPETLINIHEQVKDRPAIHQLARSFMLAAPPPDAAIVRAQEYITQRIRQYGGFAP